MTYNNEDDSIYQYAYFDVLKWLIFGKTAIGILKTDDGKSVDLLSASDLFNEGVSKLINK
jgi:hypothetical protein